jgi:hypothetical protein
MLHANCKGDDDKEVGKVKKRKHAERLPRHKSVQPVRLELRRKRQIAGRFIAF